MKIIEAIVHRFEKERHNPSSAHMRDSPLPVEQDLIDLVENIRGVFNRNVSRGYGAFHKNAIAYPFSGQLTEYLSPPGSIASFTRGLQVGYQKSIDGAQLSTGGYLFFAHYEEADHAFMLVVSLKLRAGTGIDDNTLTINKTVNFDIEHLHEAARINLTDWQTGGERYLTFIKRQRGDKDKSATDYFREFLGVTEITESTEQTKLIIQAVQKYCEDQKFEPDTAREVRSRVHAYFVECNKENKGVSLAALSMRLNDQKPDDFSTYLTENNIELSDGFEPNSRVYRALRRYRIKDSKLTLDFEESILGSRVVWDPENKLLIIRDLPKELIERLEANEIKPDDPA